MYAYAETLKGWIYINKKTKPIIIQRVKDVRVRSNFSIHRAPILGRRNRRLYRRKKDTPYSRPDFKRVYFAVINSIQNKRGWGKSHCIRMDNLASKYIFLLFNKKPFRDYNREELLARYFLLAEKVEAERSRQLSQELFRLVLEAAYIMGYTSVNMFDTVEEDTVEDYEETEKYLKNPKSIPLGQEYEICRRALERCLSNAVFLAVLFIFLLGCRPSEALGFQLKDLVHIGNLWFLDRINVLEKDKREILLGSKTINGYRYLELPDFIVPILIQMRGRVYKVYGEKDAQNFPFCCFGTQYSRPVLQKELNNALAILFAEVGVTKEAVDYAEEVLRENPTIRSECMNSPTAYLGRHQFATDATAAGLPYDYLQMIMGHAITESLLQNSDQTNPDIMRFRKYYLDQRPIIQLLSGEIGCKKYEFSDGYCSFWGEDVTVAIPEPGIYSVEISASVYNDVPALDYENGTILSRSYQCADGQGYDKFRIRQSYLCSRSMLLPEKMCKIIIEHKSVRNLEGEKFLPVIVDTEWIEKRANDFPKPRKPASDISAEFSSILSDQKNISSSEAQRRLQHSGKGTFQTGDTYSLGNTIFSVSTKKGPAVVHEPELRICTSRLGLAGTSFPFPNKLTSIRAFSWKTGVRYLVLSRKGEILSFLEQMNVDTISKYLEEDALLCALPRAYDEDDVIICLTNTGEVQATKFSAITESSKATQLTTLKETTDFIVDICYLPEGLDLLVVTTNGNGARIKINKSEMRKTLPTEPTKGVKLTDKDGQLVLCLPYPADGGLVGISEAGKGFRLAQSDSAQLTPHGRSSQTNRLFSLDIKDRIIGVFAHPAAILLLSEKGNALCVEEKAIPSHGLGTSGIRVFKAGHTILGVLPLAKEDLVK